jgi:hypothetical protein
MCLCQVVDLEGLAGVAAAVVAVLNQVLFLIGDQVAVADIGFCLLYGQVNPIASHHHQVVDPEEVAVADIAVCLV